MAGARLNFCQLRDRIYVHLFLGLRQTALRIAPPPKLKKVFSSLLAVNMLLFESVFRVGAGQVGRMGKSPKPEAGHEGNVPDSPRSDGKEYSAR